MDSERREML